MRTLCWVFTSVVFVTGCTESHVTSSADAGVGTDAAPVDAEIAADALAPDAHVVLPRCTLGTPGTMPETVGEGCFCDGPFVVRGTLAYRLGYMLEVVDLADADHPTLVTSVMHEARYSEDVHVVDDVLFAAGGPLERFDLSDPRLPVSLGTVDLGGDATALAVDGHRLVVSVRRLDESHAIVSIDATDPRTIVLGTPVELGADAAISLALVGSTAFAVLSNVASGEGSIAAIDLDTGVLTDRLANPSASSLSTVMAHAGHLFVSNLGSGVRLIDATDRGALVDVGPLAIEPETVFSIGLTGDRLIVLGGGMWLYDAEDPRALVALGHADWAFDLGHAELFGEHLIVSGGNGLLAVPLTCP